MVVKVFSMVVCSPIFGCVFLSSCLERWLAEGAKSERLREKEEVVFEGVEYICFLVA